MAPNAAVEVFNIPELVEGIPMDTGLRTRDTMKALDISQNTSDAIWGSKKIKQKIFFEPQPAPSTMPFQGCKNVPFDVLNLVHINPVLDTVGWGNQGALTHFTFEFQSLLVSLQHSAFGLEGMLITQPPALEVSFVCFVDVHYVEYHAIEKSRIGVVKDEAICGTIRGGGGVRLQDVIETIQDELPRYRKHAVGRREVTRVFAKKVILVVKSLVGYKESSVAQAQRWEEIEAWEAPVVVSPENSWLYTYPRLARLA